MLKLIVLILLIVLGVLIHYSSIQPANEVAVSNNTQISIEVVADSHLQKQTIRFKCDGRQHCSQMRTFEEADFFLKNCPDTKMDGDRDGIPCERQFNRF
ncbi:excalibur calcium-binding domain-containing protein [Aliiglaciecola sp. M165]|uniref:excalibur calcium-binding domain-containing protein n=1 Tax=Aliiglaciecola sp. M165 TaxID=2593649 RepID=UPI00117D79C8|nr:excalibur calcium-binding domain-containing protein [Aliiglaciecola sp. M165]